MHLLREKKKRKKNKMRTANADNVTLMCQKNCGRENNLFSIATTTKIDSFYDIYTALPFYVQLRPDLPAEHYTRTSNYYVIDYSVIFLIQSLTLSHISDKHSNTHSTPRSHTHTQTKHGCLSNEIKTA